MSAVKSTTLSFGLVTTPIALKKAKATAEVAFKLASPDGNPVKQVYVDEATGEMVGTRADCARGIFVGADFHAVPTEAIKAIDDSFKIEALDVDGFVPMSDVPFERAESCYFIAPGKDAGTSGTKALALLAQGLESTNRAGIGKLTLRTKQRPFVVYAVGGALVVNTLGFADAYEALEDARGALEGVEIDEKTAGLFKTLVEAQSVEIDKLNDYRDEVTPAREALIEQALAGKTIAVPVAAETKEAEGNLEDLLLASIGQIAAPTTKKKTAAKSAAKVAA